MKIQPRVRGRGGEVESQRWSEFSTGVDDGDDDDDGDFELMQK